MVTFRNGYQNFVAITRSYSVRREIWVVGSIGIVLVEDPIFFLFFRAIETEKLFNWQRKYLVDNFKNALIEHYAEKQALSRLGPETPKPRRKILCLIIGRVSV